MQKSVSAASPPKRDVFVEHLVALISLLFSSQTPCGESMLVVSSEVLIGLCVGFSPRKLGSQPRATVNLQLQTSLEPTLVLDVVCNLLLACRHIARKRDPSFARGYNDQTVLGHWKEKTQGCLDRPHVLQHSLNPLAHDIGPCIPGSSSAKQDAVGEQRR